MKANTKFFLAVIFLLGAAIVFLPAAVFAHEVYVLSPTEVQQGLQYTGFDTINSLANPHNLKIFLEIFIAVAILLVINFFFRHSSWGRAFNQSLSRLGRFGPIIVRLAISLSFFYSALSWSFLGPEISLQSLILPNILRVSLFVISALIFLGFFTELAALIALTIYTIAASYYGFYVITYLNYLGEILVLLLFGSRYLSLDRIIFGLKKSFASLQKYESTIVRVCYGIALCFTAIEVKFLHPHLTEMVINQYQLAQFHWLFPSDPILITFGAGLAELVIGLFIIFGFELRLTVLISLFYLTLSIIYFKELVWPHFMLYGISLNLVFDEERFTLDQVFDKIFKWKNS